MTGLALIDLAKYPIQSAKSSAYVELVERCRRAFVDDAAAVLPGFLTAAGRRAIASDIRPLVGRAFFCRNDHNVYLNSVDPTLGPDHPRNRLLSTNVGSVANDLLDVDGPLQRLYETPELASFIAAIVGVDKLHCSADPLGALSINVFNPGDGHDWHFDEARFTVTLMVQPAESNGYFEFIQGLRPGADDGDVDGIGSLLNGNGPEPRRLPFAEGALSIFAGRHTIHRVTPVGGNEPRLVPVLTFSETPGYQNSEAVRELFWGRTG